MSTDGTILAGFAAQNEGELKVVGETFSEERIGVGYSKDQPGDVRVDQRRRSRRPSSDGTWAEAFELTLGPSGVETPDPPTLDACES